MVQSESYFCYSVIPIKLGIKQQMLRLGGAQTQVLRHAPGATFCFGLFLAQTLSAPTIAKPLC